jgi:ADP-heptose:LPS heptosyltransferase
MSLSGFILNRLAPLLTVRRKHQPRRSAPDPRILVIRRNRMGDMIYTLPLLHSLRRHFPKAHISVACDLPGEPIALACPAVNDVIVLARGWNPIQASFKNAAFLQDYDWVIAAKGGFDSRLARLTRLTNAAIRIGFVHDVKQASPYYTDPVAPPAHAEEEHQIETLLRLLAPLGLKKMTAFAINLTLEVPAEARAFAEEILSKPPFTTSSHYMLINISSTAKLKFREEDFISLSKRILNLTDLAIGLVAAPADQQKAREIAMCMGSKRIDAIETPGAMELAALIEEADFLFTPEGGAAHLAAAMKRPALVMWSEGPFAKWHSRHERHAFVQPLPHETNIPLDRVWEAMQPFLAMKKSDVEETFGDTLQSGEFDHLEDS